MKKRSIKVLLQIMLDNIDRLECGLCILAVDLFDYEEETDVLKYIEEHRPRNSPDSYYWPIGEVKPRIKWLEYHIKKLSK